jgi:protein-S-isoprenylcysteine O-methyltransferase Ste14
MNIELICKVALIILFSLFSIIRIEYYHKARKAGYRTVIKERMRYSVWLSIFICYEVFTFFAYILFPHTLSWATVALPLWLRISGIFLGVIALSWFVWVHRSLGNNLSVKLSSKDLQTLVTDGPYRWLRHPMYTTFYILHIAVFFLTANWFIGLTWLTGLTIIIALRVKREEAMLLTRFGQQYDAYMKGTGRFLPRFKFPAGRPRHSSNAGHNTPTNKTDRIKGNRAQP